MNHQKPGKNAVSIRPGELRRPTRAASTSTGSFGRSQSIKAALVLNSDDLISKRYRVSLYRFLADNIPIISSCVWTWARLSAAAGKFETEGTMKESELQKAEQVLSALSDRMFTNNIGNRVGLSSLMPELFMSLYRDGFFGGFLTVFADGSGVDCFVPVDPTNLAVRETKGQPELVLEADNTVLPLDRPDFYYLPLNSGSNDPLGGSILKSIPFVSYIEQQLVDDMRRSSHNAGFHRLHVKITPPERMGGESDTAYTERTNQYFDDTVEMVKGCRTEDNPVTWDNVAIEYVGPSGSAATTSGWFVNHRAMIEDICAGTNLAPYLLGYSYGATTTWSGFKFDVVMRQVRSVQAEVSRFLEWIGNIELALAGVNAACSYKFDNSFAYQVQDTPAVETTRVDNLRKLYQAGLIDKEAAASKAGSLI